MNALANTQPKVPDRRATLEDLDFASGCVEWYRYPQAAADRLKATSLEAAGSACMPGEDVTLPRERVGPERAAVFVV
jgi:hypothetical protein